MKIVGVLAIGTLLAFTSEARTSHQLTTLQIEAAFPIVISLGTPQTQDEGTQISIKNNGEKTVTSIEWEIVQTVEVEGKEIKIRQRFNNRVRIRPGEKIELSNEVYFSKEEVIPTSTETRILKVKYEDGTTTIGK